MQNHDIVLSKVEEGYVAASTSSPYFCFVAESEDAAKVKVRRALDFFHGLEVRPEPKARESIMLTPLGGKRMSAKELAVA